jgi:preprotein translocase subunit SecF
MGVKDRLLQLYDVQYKKLMAFSFLLFIACLGVLAVSYSQTGEFVEKGVSLKGGITLTVPLDVPVDIHSLEDGLHARFPSADIGVREISEGGRASAVIIEASDVSVDDLKSAVPEFGVQLAEGKYSVESMGSSLGQRFFGQTLKAVIIAFVLMSVVVYFTFRSVIPSLFVIFSAACNIISTVAVLSLLNIKLSTSGIAALLMLIGYAVDTNILLTTKVLKRRTEGGSIHQRTVSAMRTGLTMTLCALTSSIIGYFFIQSDTIRQIMIIVTIGLLFDVVYTWFMNAGILRKHMERKYGAS